MITKYYDNNFTGGSEDGSLLNPYSSVQNFITNEGGTMTDDIDVICFGDVDNTIATWQGWTFGTYKVRFFGTQDGGKDLDITKTHMYSSNNTCLTINQANVNIEFFNFGFKGGNSVGNEGIKFNAFTGSRFRAYSCTFTAETGYATGTFGISDSNNSGANDVEAHNCVFHDMGTGAYDVDIYNCVFSGLDRGLRGPLKTVNSIYQNNLSDWFGSAGGTALNNLTDRASFSNDQDPILNSTLTFIGGVVFDYRLASTDTDAMGTGIGVLAELNLTRFDIDGNDRHEYKPTSNIGLDNSLPFEEVRFVNREATSGNGTTNDLTGVNAAWDSCDTAQIAMKATWPGSANGDTVVRLKCCGDAKDPTLITLDSGYSKGTDRFIIEGNDAVTNGAFEGTIDPTKFEVDGVEWTNNGPDCQIQNLQITNDNVVDLTEPVLVNNFQSSWQDVLCITRCLLEHAPGTNRQVVIESDAPGRVFRVENCILRMDTNHDSSYAIWVDNGDSPGDIEIVNCDIIVKNRGDAIRNDNDDYGLSVINTVAIFEGLATIDEFNSGVLLANNSTNNGSTENDAEPLATAVNLVTTDFIDSAGGNYRIGALSDLIGNGEGPELNPRIPWTDIDGNDRVGNITDLGFSLYVVPVTPGGNPFTAYLSGINSGQFRGQF